MFRIETNINKIRKSYVNYDLEKEKLIFKINDFYYFLSRHEEHEEYLNMINIEWKEILKQYIIENEEELTYEDVFHFPMIITEEQLFYFKLKLTENEYNYYF